MFNINEDKEFQKKQTEIIMRFNQCGIKVTIGKIYPINQEYSGIIGRSRKKLVFRLDERDES